MYTDAQIARLPKWAQDLIANQKRDITHLQARIDAMAHMTEAGPFYMEYFDPHRDEPRYYLPKYTRLFWQHGETRIELVHDKHDGLKVYAHDGTLVIHPHASNVVSAAVVHPLRKGKE